MFAPLPDVDLVVRCLLLCTKVTRANISAVYCSACTEAGAGCCHLVLSIRSPGFTMTVVPYKQLYTEAASSFADSRLSLARREKDLQRGSGVGAEKEDAD